ncbi:MAG TPA: hypothetical protein VN442_09645 [Bryobacteraceae bacterium]|nr:hypothetical protein [Bryobacteraceae bacterium]
MIKRLFLGFAVFAVAMASAETYKVTLFQPSIVEGTELKPGDYRLSVDDTKAVFASGKQSVETRVKVENADQKFSSTTVRYASADGKYSIQEIRVGGTRTKLVFHP